MVLRLTQTRPLDFAAAMSLEFAGVGAVALGAAALGAGGGVAALAAGIAAGVDLE